MIEMDTNTAYREVMNDKEYEFYMRALNTIMEGKGVEEDDLNSESEGIHPVVMHVSNVLGVAVKSIVSKSRSIPTYQARGICAKIMRDEFGMSLAKIGYHLGNRHHTTIMNTLKAINRSISDYTGLQNKYNKCQIMSTTREQ